jgi:8-oxo-dGTP diphosphatase
MKLGTLIYLKRNDQTLMLHRVKKERDIHEGKWNGLGGKFEPGETPEACAIREIEEESGLRVQIPRLHGVLTFPAFSDDEDWYAFLFTAHISAEQYAKELIDSPEGELRWIDDAELLALNLWPGDRIFLPWLDQAAFFSGRFDYIDGQLVGHEVAFYPGAISGSSSAL